MSVMHEWRWEPLDMQLADFLAGFENPDSRTLMRQTVRVLSHQVRQGDSCIDLADFADETPFEGAVFPESNAWRDQLAGLSCVGEDGAATPLILEGRRLYFQRYWQYETRLADGLVRLARQRPERPDSDWLESQLQNTNLVNAQKEAVRRAFAHGLCVISGGPGTGKTTTVASLIDLLRRWRPELRVVLAAPTGKAAARMQEALRHTETKSEYAPEVGLPQSMTLHRLLGSRRHSVNFRYHAGHPLTADVVIVDEASMVDLAMMAKLVDAVKPDARLILLGDKDQLASVEAGAVMDNICADSEHNPLAPIRVLLQQAHRFSESRGIDQLLDAVRRGDAYAAMETFASDALQDVILLDPSQAEWREVLQEKLMERLRAPGLEGLQRFQLLCALSDGSAGADGLNRQAEHLLAAQGAIPWKQTWYAGRPLLIQRNHYGLGLFNGDLGLTMDDGNGGLRVCFSIDDGEVRGFSSTRLPAHETAWAMTVHKSQGSEFDEVMLVLPARMSPLLTRELLYTAISRARRRVYVVATTDVLSGSIRNQAKRQSGLAHKLVRCRIS